MYIKIFIGVNLGSLLACIIMNIILLQPKNCKVIDCFELFEMNSGIYEVQCQTDSCTYIRGETTFQNICQNLTEVKVWETSSYECDGTFERSIIVYKIFIWDITILGILNLLILAIWIIKGEDRGSLILEKRGKKRKRSIAV